jgi:rubredoxin
MSDKTIPFPTKEDEELPPPEEFWECGACGTRVDDDSAQKVLPINLGGNPQTGQAGPTFYVCPNCHVLSMPKEIFDEIHRRMNSRIIT